MNEYPYIDIIRSNGAIRYTPAVVSTFMSLVIRGRVVHHVSIVDVRHDGTMIDR